MSSILVTGAAGAIGLTLCERLADTHYEVVGVDITTPRWDVDVPFEQMDLTSASPLPETDIVVHLAAHSRVPPVVEDPSKAFANIAMTEPVLEHARKTGARFVFASSREVYGSAIRAIEDTAETAAVNPYGASKLACEALVNSYYNCYDVPTSVLRLANTYGRYDANPRVVPLFIALATAGEELPVYGAKKVLDFVYVEDVVDALVAAIDKGLAVAGETINVGSGEGIQLTKLADRIATEIDTCPGYRVESSRAGEVGRYIADISKARALLGWEPNITLEEGLNQTIAWYRNQDSLLASIRKTT